MAVPAARGAPPRRARAVPGDGDAVGARAAGRAPAPASARSELRFSHRAFLLLTTIVPPVGLVAAAVLLWERAVHPGDVGLLVLFYLACGLGITAGFHRLFAHRAFVARRGVKIALAVLGTMAGHGPAIAWVAHHRRHHAFADEPGDPHSPHLLGGTGRRAALRGLWFAHIAWRFRGDVEVEAFRYAADLLRDRDLRFVSRHFVAITLAGLLLPGLLGFALTGGPNGAASAIVWAGLVRMFLGHHVTYAVNSLGHFAGPRRFATGDESRNVWWLALPTLGDAWHNNHHAFPTSARHGLRPLELDLTGLAIGAFARLGLASEVVRIPSERLREKEARG
jgi:stearoyl-CoA desaturase (delta-9 desaturase)